MILRKYLVSKEIQICNSSYDHVENRSKYLDHKSIGRKSRFLRAEIACLFDSLGFHPLTSLTSLTTAEKGALLDDNVVLCQEMHEHEEHLNRLGIPEERKKVIMEESLLCAKS